MAKKQIVRLTEGDLHRIIKESVNKVLKESLYGLQPMKGQELFSHISSYLQRLGDVRVSNFGNNIAVVQNC